MPTSALMIRNDRLYDVLKYIAQIVLPAVATLYFALSEIWGFPYGAEVVGTITAFDTFLGVLLGLSTKAYLKSGSQYDGTMDVVDDGESKLFTLNLDSDPYDIDKKDSVVFKINSTPPEDF